MFRPLRLLALLASCLAGVVVTMTVQPGTAAAPRWTPPPDTIVRVVGTAEEGFAIHFHDGTALFPPTDCEARAECAECGARPRARAAGPRSAPGTATSPTSSRRCGWPTSPDRAVTVHG